MVKSNWLAQVDPDLLQRAKKSRKEKREREKSQPEWVGEQSMSGSTPDPDLINDVNMLEQAQKTGLYTEDSDNDQDEIDVAEEVEEAEKNRRGID